VKNHLVGKEQIALCGEKNWHSIVTDIKDANCKKCLKVSSK
jgi:hypothetical protein